jgi:hypothetical protein
VEFLKGASLRQALNIESGVRSKTLKLIGPFAIYEENKEL